MAKKKAAKSRKRQIIFIAIIFFVLVVIAFAGTKSYLWINNLLGNDLIIKLNADKENFFLKHYETDKVQFQVYGTTNPFCKIECSSAFIDLSSGKAIEHDSFNITPATWKSKEYSFFAEKQGFGQELYSFGIECRSRKTLLCHSNEVPRKRNILITVNYDLTDNEKQIKAMAAEKIMLILQASDAAYARLAWLNSTMSGIPEIDYSKALEEILPIGMKLDEIRQGAENAKAAWEKQDYASLGQEMGNLDAKFFAVQGIANKVEEQAVLLESDAAYYNYLIEQLRFVRGSLAALTLLNVSKNSSISIASAIIDFNANLSAFRMKGSLAGKDRIVESVIGMLSYILVENETAGSAANETPSVNITISNITLNDTIKYEALTGLPLEITLPEFSYAPNEFALKEPVSRCCYLGNCTECCDTACSSNPNLYPIILLHGHDFNQRISAENSLNTFQKMQDKMGEGGYINAGSIIMSTPENSQQGVWGKQRKPIVVKASYYFDIYTDMGKGRVIETKADSIDTYALRLKDIVENVRLKAGSDKVIIIAHSMGGLVARRYMQVFPDNKVETLVMIGTPNQGIDSSILRYCSLFGAKLECENMGENSLFINKLNNAVENRSRYYVFIGTGCGMGNATGDGVVRADSAFLKGATNYFVNGNCDSSSFTYLHETMLDPLEYPEVYERIKEIIH